MIDNIGYSSTFYFLAALGAALLVIFIIYAVRDNARTKRERLSVIFAASAQKGDKKWLRNSSITL